MMSAIQIELEDDLLELLKQLQQPVPQAARELMVMELFRRGTISSGKASQLLGMSRGQFIAHAADLGIPFFEMTEDEWESERKLSQEL